MVKQKDFQNVMRCEPIHFNNCTIIKNDHPNWEMIGAKYEVFVGESTTPNYVTNDLWDLLKELNKTSLIF